MFSKTKRFSESLISFEFANKKKISLPPSSQRVSKSPQKDQLSINLQPEVLQQRESKRSIHTKLSQSPYSQGLSKSPTLKSSCKRINEEDFEAKYSTNKNRISTNSVKKINTNSSAISAKKERNQNDYMNYENQHKQSSGLNPISYTSHDNLLLIKAKLEGERSILVDQNLQEHKKQLLQEEDVSQYNQNHEGRNYEKNNQEKTLNRLSQNRRNETSLDNPFNKTANEDFFHNKENIFYEEELQQEKEIQKYNKTLKKFKDLRYKQKFQRQSFLDSSQDQDYLYQTLIESLGQHDNQSKNDLKSILDKEKLNTKNIEILNDKNQQINQIIKNKQDEGEFSIVNIPIQQKQNEIINQNQQDNQLLQDLSVCVNQQNEKKLQNNQSKIQNINRDQQKMLQIPYEDNLVILLQKVQEQKKKITNLEEIVEKKDEKIKNLEKEIFQLKTYYEFKDKHQQNYLNNCLTNYLQLQADYENLKQSFDQSQNAQQAYVTSRQEQEQQLKLIQELKRQVIESEKIVEQQHEQIIQFRGNLRIFCRIKPVLDYETELKCRDMIQSQLTIQINQRHKQVIELKQDENSKFFFDSVFDMNSTQEDVFNQTQPFIQCALNGDQIAIIAYGQTGSGKTYTMEGVQDKDNIGINSQSGILQRTAAYLFKEKERVHIHRNLVFSVGVIEVYCEELRDLLQTDEKVQSKLEILQLNKRIKVVNQVFQVVKNAEELLSLIKRSSMNRITDKTAQNNRSSRSHCIYQIKIYENDQEKGGINIVDLAGSESFQATSNKRESSFINKSLTTLKRIITMLSDRQFLVQSKIPYRESKLTRLLQDSLGGNSKTLVFVTVCPLEENFVQTKESLKFISKATF
ncbi:hypothetical protein ABPG74_021239 [Tetrahymena malaccensis]